MHPTGRQATKADIPAIEGILLDTLTWLSEMGQPLWSKREVTWEKLSKQYQSDNFFIAYADATPAGCMALVDAGPFF